MTLITTGDLDNTPCENSYIYTSDLNRFQSDFNNSNSESDDSKGNYNN